MTVSRRLLNTLPMLAVVLAFAGNAQAEDVLDARHVIDESSITVDRVREETRKSGEMDSFLKDAKGVLIIPKLYKAGFIIGGSFGDGVLMARMPDGSFSDPAFYRMTGGSLGLQIGMQSAEVVFIILTEKGLSAVMHDEFKLGANVGIAIGTIGAGAEGATTTHVGQDIVAYSKNAGLFAGGSFEGSAIKPRKDWNAAVYGVDNDDVRAITQRSELRASLNLKDTLARGTASAAPAASMDSGRPSHAPISSSPVEAPANAPISSPVQPETRR